MAAISRRRTALLRRFFCRLRTIIHWARPILATTATSTTKASTASRHSGGTTHASPR